MIACLVIVSVLSMREMNFVRFPTEDATSARYLAAMHAGRLAAKHDPGAPTRFGFRCGDAEWQHVDMPYASVFGTDRPGDRRAER